MLLLIVAQFAGITGFPMNRKIAYLLLLLAVTAMTFSALVEKNVISIKEIRLKKWALPPEKREDKSFVFIIPAYNCSDVCQKSLSAIFNKTYQNFRVIYIDDGSTDNTHEIAEDFQEELPDPSKLTVLRFEERKGAVERLYEQSLHCKNSEIIIFIKGNGWLPETNILEKLNNLYKNHDIWVAYSSGLNSRTKKKATCYTLCSRGFFSSLIRRKSTGSPRFKSFYAGLFKQIKLEDFFFRGKFVDDLHDFAYFFPLLEMADSHAVHFEEPFFHYVQKTFHDFDRPSRKSPVKCEQRIRTSVPYEALSSLAVESKLDKRTDLLIYSYNRPMQLYALLESVAKYAKGFEKISVIYRASTEAFSRGYDVLKNDFPHVNFITQSKNPHGDFQDLTLETVFKNSSSPFITFAVDDMILKDYVDISECVQEMEKTSAYLFSLRLGKNIDFCYMADIPAEVPFHVDLGNGIMAWQTDAARGDWVYADSVDMTIYRKKDLEDVFYKISFRTPNELEPAWSNFEKPTIPNRKKIGLCYEFSKAVNIPINLVNISDNFNMNLHSPEELLEKFEAGLKINIDDLDKVNNQSVHMEYEPIFIERNPVD